MFFCICATSTQYFRQSHFMTPYAIKFALKRAAERKKPTSNSSNLSLFESCDSPGSWINNKTVTSRCNSNQSTFSLQNFVTCKSDTII